MPWFAREFKPGQGERTSPGPGGDQVAKLCAEVRERRGRRKRYDKCMLIVQNSNRSGLNRFMAKLLTRSMGK